VRHLDEGKEMQLVRVLKERDTDADRFAKRTSGGGLDGNAGERQNLNSRPEEKSCVPFSATSGQKGSGKRVLKGCRARMKKKTAN